MKAKVLAVCLSLLLGAATAAFGGRLSFQEHAAVQESLARVHPRMRASWLRAHGLDDSYYTTFHKPESTGLVCRGRWPWGPSWELAGKDTFLYLGSGSGVRILSMADSVQPRMLGQINARGLVSQVVVQDSLLFVACGSWGAQIYSVSDPANPRELGSMNAVISDVWVKDSFCYAVGGDSLRIYNVASPSQPSLVGAVRDSGDLVVVANGYAFSAGRWVMNIYNVTDPAHPTWANSRSGPAYAMFVRRNLLFCTGYDPDYLSALNITDPLSITEVGRVNGYGGEGLYVDDSCAYLSCTNDHHGLFVIDVSDSSRPSLRDSIDPEGAEEWEPHVPRYPGYGYLADDFGGLLTLDLHDESDVSIAWSSYKASQAVDVVVDGQRAYVANQYSGVQIVSVVDPAKPVSVGSLRAPDGVFRLDWAAPYLFAACIDAGVLVVETTVVGVRETRGGINTRPGFLVSPNPAGEVAYVQFGEPFGRGSRLSLYDISGRRKLMRQVGREVTSIELKTTGLTPGLYFVRVENETGVLSSKLVKR